ncbi:Uncharacterized membrane protein [Pedobacter sp. ok626]|uniref:DUF1622 domain-containing protein n=1 Tax=Pedobacter sp. ok626 TaxID=1761882 RepID=UPI00088697CB|nr:DUF1622 domain-containing protein [Pedobacter sp. ok626]SDJ08411.1 Uncharacterized membrane protein [Pedobacter sp. ok626]
MNYVLQSLSEIISYASIAIICYGAALGLLKFISNELSRFKNSFSLEKTVQIKIEVGYYLLLGLEFLIASDIIDTILNPSFDDLGILAGTVVIRTGLSFFLNKEIESIAENKVPENKKRA